MLSRLFARFRRWTGRYDASFFTGEWFAGWRELAPVLARLVSHEPRWRAILDYGCGPGAMIDPMTERGYRYIGCDVSPEARALYLAHYGRHPDRYVASLDALAGQSFDLLLSFDVLEHMQDAEIDALLARCGAIPEALLNISRERHIPGHVNIKGDEAWIAFFESRQWRYERERTERLRALYLELRPGGPDLWHRNLFLISRA